MIPDKEKTIAMLERHEKRVLKPYTDTVGKITIGVGRNLSDRGISDAECDVLRDNDIDAVWTELLKALPWVESLDQPRQRALLDMGFNMGIPTLLTFKNTLALLHSGDYEGASFNMLQSRWAGQVGARAQELAQIIKTGND